MIEVRTMCFANGEEKTKYDKLAIDWVKYADLEVKQGNVPMEFKEFYTKKGVSFKFGGNGPVKTNKTLKTPVIDEKTEETKDLAYWREEYIKVVGKKYFNAWGIEKLQEKINLHING